uniref:Uncharacterized protein n=1 Tax=Sphaerodactylus townsendi TaxID=933632 RepID=A0ACB8FPP9_9SAUR
MLTAPARRLVSSQSHLLVVTELLLQVRHLRFLLPPGRPHEKKQKHQTQHGRRCNTTTKGPAACLAPALSQAGRAGSGSERFPRRRRAGEESEDTHAQWDVGRMLATGHMWCLFKLWACPLKLPAPQPASARPRGGLLLLQVRPSKARHAQLQPAVNAAAPHVTWQESARGGPPRMSPLELRQW